MAYDSFFFSKPILKPEPIIHQMQTSFFRKLIPNVTANEPYERLKLLSYKTFFTRKWKWNVELSI